MWRKLPLVEREMRNVLLRVHGKQDQADAKLDTDAWPCRDDAFTTLIQWLYGRWGGGAGWGRAAVG